MQGSLRKFAETTGVAHFTTVYNYARRGKESFEKRFPSAKLKTKERYVVEWKE